MSKIHHSDGGASVVAFLHSHRGRHCILLILSFVLLIVGLLPQARASGSARQPFNVSLNLYPFGHTAAIQQRAAEDSGIHLEGPLTVDSHVPGAHSAMTADFDRDGHLDVVAAARDDGRIIWYRSLGIEPPTFQAFFVGVVPGAYVAYPADLNRDGRMDIVAVGVGVLSPSAVEEEAAVLGTGSLQWFMNDGQPIPGFAQVAITTGLNYPVSTAVADVDSDGDPDVLAASRDDNTVRWYEHNGADFPQFAEHLITNNADGAVSVDVGDVDGDGDMDVASASEDDDKIAWYVNNGANQFSERIVRQANAPAPQGIDYAKSVRIVDMDGDGDADLLYGSENGNEVGWYENDGSGQPQFTQRVIDIGRDHVKYVAAADVDGNGHLDVLSASSADGVIAWYKNNGERLPKFSSYIITNAAIGARFVHSADLDGDGDLDVLMASRDDGRIAWYRNRIIHRTSLYPTQSQRTLGKIEAARHVRAADLDHDGDLDLVATGNRDVLWFENNGARPPSYTSRSITSGVNGGRWVDLSDLDGDGDVDIVVASTKNNRLLWYENLGGVPPSFKERILSQALDAPRAVLSADLDRDGDLDLYTASHGDNKVAWFENNGARPPDFVQRVVATDAYYARSVYAADLDGDGDLDIISAAQSSDQVAWYENQRGQPLVFVKRIVSKSADGVQHVHAADMDGDGDMDILSASEFDRKIAWYENQGGSTPGFLERTIDLDAPGAHALYTIDADGDGDQDLFAAVEYSNAFTWYENNGQRPASFVKHVIYDQAIAAHSIYAADLDRDGDLDVMSTSRDDGRIHWFENLGGQYRLMTQTSGGGQADGALIAVLQHNGRAGDPTIRLTNLDLEFRDAAGNLLSTPDLAAQVQAVSVYGEACCDGVYTPGVDPLILRFELINLAVNGRILIPLSLGNQPVYSAFGVPATLYLRVEATTACSASAGGLTISTRTTRQTAVDSQSGDPLLAELMPDLNTDSLPELDVNKWLHINEIAADNDGDWTDPDEPTEHPDWIELYNSGPLPINLGGMYLTDDLSAPTRYRIADGVMIASHSYVVFIADSESDQGALHTNFSLAKGGESVGLFDSDAQGNRPIDFLTFGPQSTDVTYGRYPDGFGPWIALPSSTPGAANVTAGLNHHFFLPFITHNVRC